MDVRTTAKTTAIGRENDCRDDELSENLARVGADCFDCTDDGDWT